MTIRIPSVFPPKAWWLHPRKERSSDLKSLANDTAVAASKIFVEMMHNEWSTLKAGMGPDGDGDDQD